MSEVGQSDILSGLVCRQKTHARISDYIREKKSYSVFDTRNTFIKCICPLSNILYNCRVIAYDLLGLQEAVHGQILRMRYVRLIG